MHRDGLQVTPENLTVLAPHRALLLPHGSSVRSLFRYVFDVVEQRSTMALFTARADGGSASPTQHDFCKACLWQVTDASIDFRDPNPN